MDRDEKRKEIRDKKIEILKKQRDRFDEMIKKMEEEDAD